MATNTPNYKLIKPGEEEFYDVNISNENMDTLDRVLKEQEDAVNSNLAESEIHLAGGTTNAITIATPQGNYSYSQFKQLRFKAVANSTGNVTINVDGKGVVPALKFDGTQLPAGAIKKDKVYDWYYDESNGGRFFLIAKASGDATAGDVLAGKKASNDDGDLVGTMPNIGRQIITPTTTNRAIPKGYHDGTGYVQGSPNIIPSNIRKGINIFDVNGTLEGISPGDFQVYSVNSISYQGEATSPTPTARGLKVSVGGRYRIRWILGKYGSSDGSSRYVYGRLYKNGSPLTPLRSVFSNQAGVTTLFVEDVDLLPTDILKIYAWTDGGQWVTVSTHMSAVSIYIGFSEGN